METFGIVAIVIAGSIMMIITMVNNHRYNIVLRERLVTHKRIIYSLERYRWLTEMGYRETANSFNMIG